MTDKTILYNRPDITYYFKQERKVSILIDMTIRNRHLKNNHTKNSQIPTSISP